MVTIVIKQDNVSGKPGNEKGRPFLIHIGKEPTTTIGAQEYLEKGYYINHQRGFYGLVTSYWKDEQTLKDHINPYYHNQIKQ